MLSLGREENPVDHPSAVGANLIDLTVEMPRGLQPSLSDLLHRRDYGGQVFVVETGQELLDRPPPRGALVVAPAVDHLALAAGNGSLRLPPPPPPRIASAPGHREDCSRRAPRAKDSSNAGTETEKRLDPECPRTRPLLGRRGLPQSAVDLAQVVALDRALELFVVEDLLEG